MTENQLLRNVLELCSWLGITTAHFRPARTERGWRTAVQGDGKGFVDLVLVARGGVKWRETKSDNGTLDPDQRSWRDVLLAADQDWGVWKPADWKSGRIQAELEDLAKGDAHAALH